MDILIIAMGSHGDVHPMVGLAATLRARGYDAAVLTCPYYEDMIRRAGVPLIPMGTSADLLETMQDPRLWDGHKAFEIVTERMILRFMRPIYKLIAERYVPGRTMLVAPPTSFGARIAREKLGIPLATVHLAPAGIQSVYQSPVLPPLLWDDWVPIWFKRIQYWIINDLVIDRKCAGPVNQFRAELGLPPVRGIFKSWWNSPDRVLCMFPEWYAPKQPDWPAAATFTGFPMWDESSVTPLSPEVEEFLQAGDAPIVFTPGSAMIHGQKFFAAAAGACQQLGQRGILLTRHGDQIPASLPESVRHFSYVPLSRLLNRSAAMVHHGGVGTVAQALAAGIPQVTMPMAHDQFDNAARLERLGIGATLPRHKFTADRLARTLEPLLESRDVFRSCQFRRSQLVGANPLSLAADWIERLSPAPIRRYRAAG
jgi:UDP:flavonoid glycosyltransferase YjiC (YdhE family)